MSVLCKYYFIFLATNCEVLFEKMMQNWTSVFNKKVVARFDKKSGILEKEPKRKIYYWGLWRRAYYWWLKEDPIIKNPSEKLITKKLKRTLRGPSGVLGPSITFASQKNFFFFLMMGINIHMKLLVLGGLVFILPIT